MLPDLSGGGDGGEGTDLISINPDWSLLLLGLVLLLRAGIRTSFLVSPEGFDHH